MSILPDEIIHNHVLTQLPVKSLLRFKSVCKYWYNLINSSTFLNIYRRYAIESRDYYSSDDLLIVNYKSVFKNNCGQSFTYLYAPRFSRGISFDIDSKIDVTTSGIVGHSCNGVICLYMCLRGFKLYNPLTRECHVIFEPHYYRLKYPLIQRVCGFGYDCVSNDYKIIQISKFAKYNSIPLAQIYSTRTNSWKRYIICSFVTNILPRGNSAVNNSLHYICSKKTVTDTCLSIFTIDLHTEKFRCMALPIKLMENDAKGCRLIASNGRLYFSMSDIKSLQATIWVMKEYGVTESWTKLYDLEGDIVKSRIISYNLSKEGAQVLVIKPVDEESDELVWYNFEDKSFRKVNVPGKRKYSTNRCLSMTGSLAPILGSTTTTQAEE